METDKRDKVFAQYIDQYLPVIERTLNELRLNQKNLIIPYAQFLFSIIDYFGLLFSVSQGQYKKRDKINFNNFLGSTFFPSQDRCKNEFLWFIRNGVIHQIFPKGTGIGLSKVNCLFFLDNNNGNIITLNLAYLDSILMLAIESLIENLRTDDKALINLYEILIINHYGFDDHKELAGVIDSSFGGDMTRILTNCS